MNDPGMDRSCRFKQTTDRSNPANEDEHGCCWLQVCLSGTRSAWEMPIKSARRGNPTALRFRRDVGSRGERDSREEFSEEGRGRLLNSCARPLDLLFARLPEQLWQLSKARGGSRAFFLLAKATTDFLVILRVEISKNYTRQKRPLDEFLCF